MRMTTDSNSVYTFGSVNDYTDLKTFNLPFDIVGISSEIAMVNNSQELVSITLIINTCTDKDVSKHTFIQDILDY